ncbi:MAG TPA: ACT domain-containing protein, partial [Deinococcales bacterium]|nr:ACT domain-containing protein [Deinococcales bacterium]
GLRLEWASADLGEVHPNTVKLTVTGEPGAFDVLASSVGGGVIEVLNVNGFSVHFTGSQSTLLVLHRDTFGAIARVTRVVADDRVNIATLTGNRERRGGAALMALELDQPLSPEAVDRVAALPETTWVRMLAPVMDAGEATGGP